MSHLSFAEAPTNLVSDLSNRKNIKAESGKRRAGAARCASLN
jgi:hypothetical protein